MADEDVPVQGMRGQDHHLSRRLQAIPGMEEEPGRDEQVAEGA